MIEQLRQWSARLRLARDANVTLITAVVLVPMMFALGFCIDYARAEMLQSRIAAVADAAALAGTDTDYINQSASTTQAAVTQFFTAQVANYQDFSFNSSSQLIVTVGNSGGVNLGRTVTVAWGGQSLNMFSGILGSASLAISGLSQSYATAAPNINFFLVMDKSPSMLLPTTSTGISEVQGVTADKCAFACHQKYPGQGYVKDANGRTVVIDQNFYNSGASSGYNTYYLLDSSNNLYNSSGTKLGTVTITTSTTGAYTFRYTVLLKTYTIYGYYADGYWLTHNYTKIYPSGSAIDLRVSDETAAAQALIPYATQQESINSVTYQLQFFAYDWTHPSASSPVTQYSSMADVATLSSSSVPNLDATTDWWNANNAYNSTCCTQGDAVTETTNMLSSMNAVMPTPGTGASTTSPQEVMMLITDGVSDEVISGTRTNREFNTSDIAQCTKIKNRGIKIAILYTYYDSNVLAGDTWSQTNVVPYLPNVLPALQSCASNGSNGQPLVYTVQSNQSIATALQTLFALTITNSHLIQ